jgi:hypothetical protein
MMTSTSRRHATSIQIVARRVTVVRSNRTRSGVAALESDVFEPKSRGSNNLKPQSRMITLITAAAAVWSVLALFGHY